MIRIVESPAMAGVSSPGLYLGGRRYWQVGSTGHAVEVCQLFSASASGISGVAGDGVKDKVVETPGSMLDTIPYNEPPQGLHQRPKASFVISTIPYLAAHF